MPTASSPAPMPQGERNEEQAPQEEALEGVGKSLQAPYDEARPPSPINPKVSQLGIRVARSHPPARTTPKTSKVRHLLLPLLASKMWEGGASPWNSRHIPPLASRFAPKNRVRW